MFKIETHLHTNVISCCGKLSPEEVLEGYSKAGYHGIVVTEHFMRYTFQWLKVDTVSDEEKWDIFQNGYRRLKQLADPYNIRIYLGAEVRFDEGPPNDYLVYGDIGKALAETERVFCGDLAQLHEATERIGAVIIQAHPFRGECVPADPRYLDGIEVYNGHPRHENRNDLASNFAEEHPQLICFSGSDCHQLPDIGRSGIMVETLPENEIELANMIKERRFEMIVPGAE